MRRICICGPTANNTTTSMAPRHKLPPIVESITLWPQSLDTFKHTLHGVSVIAHWAQVVTRRILHRMYLQCGNTDTYLHPWTLFSHPLPFPHLLFSTTLYTKVPSWYYLQYSSASFSNHLFTTIFFVLTSTTHKFVPRSQRLTSLCFFGLVRWCCDQATSIPWRKRHFLLSSGDDIDGNIICCCDTNRVIKIVKDVKFFYQTKKKLTC